MSKPTPKQQVESQFGTRADLVSAIVSIVGDEGDTRRRLSGTTNKKLLRIHEVAKTVQDKFGGKSGLIDAIASLQFATGKANDGWREKMEGYTVKRLLDHHRQLSTTGPGAKAKS